MTSFLMLMILYSQMDFQKAILIDAFTRGIYKSASSITLLPALIIFCLTFVPI